MGTFFIKHLTKYTYSNTVIDGATLIRLHPINDEYQKVISHLLTTTNNAYVDTFDDFYGNRVGTVMVTEPHTELSIESDIEVLTTQKMFPDDTLDIKSQWDAVSASKKQIDVIDFLKPKPFIGSEDVTNIINSFDISSKLPHRVVQALCDYVFTNFKYIQGVTNVDTILEDVWKLKAGVCQDFTNILLQMIRMAGIPARYVSGYICTSNSITRGEGATHAWVEAYIPNYGWFGVDPTNNIMANENHVRLAIGRDYDDCSPVKGVFKGKVESELFVKVEVSTTKNNDTNSLKSIDISKSETSNNSFQRNLERIQQQQQQQQ